MRPSRTLVILTSMTAATTLVSACGTTNVIEGSGATSTGGCRNPIVSRGDDPEIFVRAKDNCGSDMFSITGEILYLPDAHCFAFRAGYGTTDDVPAVAVWPKGTRPIKEDGRPGVLIGGQRIFPGDFVRGGISVRPAVGLPKVDSRCLGEKDVGPGIHYDQTAAYIASIVSVNPPRSK